MARINLQLQPNEGIVLQNEDVARKLRKGHDDGALILTTKNLYFYKGRGRKADIMILPLNQIKVVRGQAQAVVGGSKMNPTLQIYWNNGQEEYEFKKISRAANARKEIEKWIVSIQQLVMEINASSNTVFSGPFQGRRAARTQQQAMQQPINIYVQQPDLGYQDAAGNMGNAAYAAPNPAPNPVQDPAPSEPVVTKVSGKCVACMAPIIGNKGETIRCPYCGTEQIL